MAQSLFKTTHFILGIFGCANFHTELVFRSLCLSTTIYDGSDENIQQK